MFLKSTTLIHNDNNDSCKHFDQDNIFNRFKLVEFPISIVGLKKSQYLDVEKDLNKCAYLKTKCDGTLMKFEEAREISASHRAFILKQVDSHTLCITFHPLNECVAKAKQKNAVDNRFICDLRLIQVDGTRCCHNEFHSEIGRYYLCGKYEFCQLTHYPTLVDFEEVVIHSKNTKYARIYNKSKYIATKFEYMKIPCLTVLPSSFIIPPNSSLRIKILLSASSLKVDSTITFQVRNADLRGDYDLSEEKENYIVYTIKLSSKVLYNKKPKPMVVESLHKLIEQSQRYTYITKKEKNMILERKKISDNQMQIMKATAKKKPKIKTLTTRKGEDCVNMPIISKLRSNFCEVDRPKIATYSVLDVLFFPLIVNFGRICIHTYGEQEILIKNNTIYDISIEFQIDDYVLYTDDKYKFKSIKLKSMNETSMKIFCFGYISGNHTASFEYTIDGIFNRKHPYALQVGDPGLLVKEKSLKFGMTTTDSFITSVPVRIYNVYNVAVNYQWHLISAETPYEVLPEAGSIPEYSCTICEINYIFNPTKTKNHEIELVSNCTVTKVSTFELSLFTRKLAVKFLQPDVLFRDITLNTETKQQVKLENSSREMVTFNVLDTLIPGLRIEPMSGNIGPKTIIILTMIVKISCVLEFSVDVIVKINNKENVELNVSGNVVEPKLTISPKYISLPRIPSNMIAYIPVTINNLSHLKSEIEVIDTDDEDMFLVYAAQGQEKIRIFNFSVEAGQSKTIFIRVYDTIRREYDMYIPFRINGLIGPPDLNSNSMELSNYLRNFEQEYEDYSRIKINLMDKEIPYCRIAGVLTVPWIHISMDRFEIDYVPTGSNKIDFTMTNISKYDLHVTILTSKLCPYFSLSLDLTSCENESITNESSIKFELNKGQKVSLTINFYPKGNGRFVATAPFYLDKQMTIAYHNLTFIGNRQTPLMIPSTYRLIFPPTKVGVELKRIITIDLKANSDLDSFSCMSEEEPHLTCTFIQIELVSDVDVSTVVTVSITVFSSTPYSRNLVIGFYHSSGSFCEIEVAFCFTQCILTLHTECFMEPENNPYPYYPESSQTELYEYMQTCVQFLEKWMYQQGFRRDLNPNIPDTFYAISSSLSSHSTAKTAKLKGINVSYLNFMKRIAGPLMKNVRKISEQGGEENYRIVKEIHDTYQEILKLLKARGANLLLLQSKFLLSYEQFVTFSENVAPKGNADIILTQELLGDVELFNRLSKQSWVDFILQSYKVFVMDSCFFDCVCVSAENRNVVTILIKWYNDNIMLQRNALRGANKPTKVINNITTDLSDGIAIISTFLTYCPFLGSTFSTFAEITSESSNIGVIIHNACLIIEAMNQLRFSFPLDSKDFVEPNFIQMLFLSIHIYVILPMFNVKDTITFNPPLLRSSTRVLSVFPTSKETLNFNFVFLNYSNNNFVVEKAEEGGGKKMLLIVKYFANFVKDDDCTLLVHGYNKTRIFDTYVIFKLRGKVGCLNPIKKWKLTGPLYRSVKVDGSVASPFTTAANFTLSLTDVEPTLPVEFGSDNKPYKFYLRRLTLLDKEVTLSGHPKEGGGSDVIEDKIYLQITCLSTQIGNSWIWFRSDLGEFFIKITTHPRWELPLDTFQVPVQTWPMDPCSCGEACECYRTAVLNIPHRNELMITALRTCLLEFLSEVMLQVFDSLIESTTGKIILGTLLEEGGTNMSDVNHILRSKLDYDIKSKTMKPRLDRVTLAHHTSAVLTLPITLAARGISDKYSVSLISDCGMDIRTYKIIFYEPNAE